MLRSTIVMMGIALGLVACGDETVTPTDDAGADGVDSGARIDSGTRADAGPDAGIAGDPYEAAQAAQRTMTAELCECSYMEQGFASAADCVAANLGSSQAQACDQVGYDAAPDALAHYFSCITHNNRALSTCLEAADCDTAAIDACEGVECDDPPMAAAEAYVAARGPCVAEMITGPAGTCPEGALVMTTGMAVFAGTTIGAGNDSSGGTTECGGEDAPDRAFRWAAPSAGTYVFDTVGSTFDTILYLRGACTETTTLACSDDIEVAANNLRSRTMLTMTAGQEIVVIVDGYGDAGAGDFVVNIEPMSTTPTDGGMPMDAGVADAGTTPKP
ncbi:MAG: hypothetical protein M3Y87_04570 [Myxococcota bacterium]|nr:hypothetical protein [Myxococcota bacterium]